MSGPGSLIRFQSLGITDDLANRHAALRVKILPLNYIGSRYFLNFRPMFRAAPALDQSVVSDVSVRRPRLLRIAFAAIGVLAVFIFNRLGARGVGSDLRNPDQHP